MEILSTAMNDRHGGEKKYHSGKVIPIIAKFPAYGKLLAERLRWHNPPTLVFIEVGGGEAWQRAKKWQQHSDFHVLVLRQEQEPSALKWPVNQCQCLIEWMVGPPVALIFSLVKTLLNSGAVLVAAMPMWVDHNSPSHYFDPATQKFIQARECLRIYHPGGRDDAAR